MADTEKGSDLLRGLPALVAGALASLAVVVYPLGLFAYWIQIWREYTHDATTALYAASLLPPPVLAGSSLDLLPAAFAAFFVASAVGSATGVLTILPMLMDDARPDSYGRVARILFSGPGRIVVFVLQTVPAMAAPWALDLVTLNSPNDVFFYLCAVTIAAAGGLLQALLLNRGVKREETVEEDKPLPTGVQSILALVTSMILAAVFLVPLYSPSLANIRFSDVPSGDAKLLTHSQGYWYVLKSGDRSVTALQDESVGTATITPP